LIAIERGAVLQASPDLPDYTTKFVVGALSAGELRPDQAGANMLITAEKAENIAFTGGGLIDGGGRFFVEEDLGYIYRMKEGRPFTFFLQDAIKLITISPSRWRPVDSAPFGLQGYAHSRYSY
jgi:hypothetical protein